MKRILVIMISLFFYHQLYSQQTNATAGVDATGSKGSASITIGQQDFINYSTATGYSNEGVQQPYELFAVSNLWTGAASANWFDAGNWSVGVPTNTIGAIILATPANQPIIASNNTATADSLVIQSGATLTNNSMS